jgi:hypothetical protein
MDPAGGEIPASMHGSLIAATPSCIAIGTRPEDDGETEIILGGDRHGESDTLAYKATLKTPSKRIAVRSVLGATLLEKPVASTETGLVVWVNDTKEPNRITIEIIPD